MINKDMQIELQAVFAQHLEVIQNQPLLFVCYTLFIYSQIAFSLIIYGTNQNLFLSKLERSNM